MLDMDSYVSTQEEWSRANDEGVESGARKRVVDACEVIRAAGNQITLEKVLIVGPQHGYEPDELTQIGVKDILVVDVVPSFCEECRMQGFDVVESPMEELSKRVEGKWNIYASHSLEHSYDIARTIQELRAVCLQWCFVIVPIETMEASKDLAHCSQFYREEQLWELFAEWICVWRSVAYSRTSLKGEARALFAVKG